MFKNLNFKSTDKKKILRLFLIISLVFLVALVILAPAVVQAAETKGPTDQPSPAPAPKTSPAPTTSPAPGTSPTPAPAAPGADTVSKLLSNVGQYAVSIISTIGSALIALFGKILIIMMEVLVWISQYNNFIDNPYVNKGWVVLRDLVNMFFVLGLLFIAFVTVLKIEKYPWNRLLARLLIMAVLVNFSKTICGIIIDFFQVIMLTFVNAYKDITGANMTNALKVQEWLQLNVGTGDTSWQDGLLAIGGIVLGFIYVIVALIVVTIFCVMLALRMIALWILVTLSPLAFFAWAFESGKIAQYSQQWWNEFFNYCIIGPFIAFFLWLSLVTMVQLNFNQMVPGYDASKRQGANIKDMQGGKMDNLLSILIGVVMLVAGLSQAGKMGVAGASLATSAASKIKDQTVGRMERAATRVGTAAYGGARAVVRVPLKAAGALATAPFKPIKPYAEGLAAGAKEKIQRGRWTRLVTKEGREQYGKELEARGRAVVAGGLERRNMRAEQAQNYKKIRPDINWENPEQIRTNMENQLVREIDPVTGKKTGKIAKVKNQDPRMWEAYYTALADNGKLKYKDIEDMQNMNFMTEMGDREKQVFLEDMEKRSEKKTHIKKAFSSLIYNEETNEYEDISGLEERGDQARGRAQTAKVNLSGLDFNKITKKEKDGTFKIKRDAQGNFDKAFTDLPAETQQYLITAETKYTNLLARGERKEADSQDFYALARSTEIRNKKMGEIRKGIGTASESDLNEAGKQANMGDIMQNPPDYAVAEVNGFTDQIPRIGKLDKIARENINVKARFLMADNHERVALIAANKNLFDNSLHDKSAVELGAMDNIKKLDNVRDTMDEDQLEKYQKLIIESSSQFNAIGQKLEGGEGQASGTLEVRIREKRAKTGVTVGLENKLKQLLPTATPAGIRDNMRFINTQAGEILKKTEGMEAGERHDIIVRRLEGTTNLDEAGRGQMADYLIENEVKIRTREQKTREVKEKVAVNIRLIGEETNKQWKSGKKDAGRIEFGINTLISQINSEIEKGALSEDAFDSSKVEQELTKLKNALTSARDDDEFNKALGGFGNSMEALGYKVKKKETRR